MTFRATTIKKTRHAPFGKRGAPDSVENYDLAEFVRNAKTTARQFPRDVFGWAHHTASTAFDTALEGNLHGSTILGAVRANRAELNARLGLATDADLRIDDFQMGFMLIRKILERHQDVINIDLGEVVLGGSFRFRHGFHLSFIYR